MLQIRNVVFINTGMLKSDLNLNIVCIILYSASENLQLYTVWVSGYVFNRVAWLLIKGQHFNDECGRKQMKMCSFGHNSG